MLLFLFVVHVAATFFMIGAVWFIAIVHYPLFKFVRTEDFQTVEKMHVRYASYIFFPTMFVEAISAIFLVWAYWGSSYFTWTALNFLLLLVIWGATFIQLMPIHNKLLEGYDEEVHQKLIGAHYFRGILWIMRGFLLLGMAIHIS